MLRLIFIIGLIAGTLSFSESVNGVLLTLKAEKQELMAAVGRQFAQATAMNAGPVVEVTDETFETEVLRKPGTVLLHFWAEWSGPSKMIAPSLEDMAFEMSDELTFAKINVDESPATPEMYGVRGVPTLLLFKDGELAGKKVGAAPKDLLVDWVESVLYD
jgi:thioredoxin 1